MRQHQLLQHQRQMLAQQAYQNNMGAGMPMGMQQLSQQQLHQLQQQQQGRFRPVRRQLVLRWC